MRGKLCAGILNADEPFVKARNFSDRHGLINDHGFIFHGSDRKPLTAGCFTPGGNGRSAAVHPDRERRFFLLYGQNSGQDAQSTSAAH